jgi:hypothetical protein
VPETDFPRPAPFRLASIGMRRLAVVFWVVAVALVPLGLLTDGVRALVFLPGPSVFTAWFAWTVLWRPGVVATADALVVVDVRRTTRVPWSRVLEVRSRFGLEVVTSEGDRRTWTAPRPTARLRVLPPTTADDVPARRAAAAAADLPTISVEEAAVRLRAFVPVVEVLDGPPPVRVAAAPIEHHVHGWSVLALVVLGIVGSMTGAQV